METLLLWLVAVLLVNDSLFGWGYEVKSSSSHHGSWETITDNPTACELWVIIETLVFAPTETGWQRHTDSADASRLTSTSGEESSSSVKQPKGSPALYQVNLTTGQENLVKNPVGDGDRNINAIGYHPAENIIYGVIQTSTGDSNLIAIRADGSSSILDTVPHAMGGRRYNLNVGEITDTGQFYFGTGGKVWWRMDLADPKSDTYRTIVESGTSDSDYAINDWVQVPGTQGSYFYSVGEDTSISPTESILMKWSTSDHTWTIVRRMGHISGKDHWGALYADSNGNMYGSENNSGDIYQFPITAIEAGGTPVFLTAGTPSSRNDGARCHAAGL
ncbi:hypothetical protein ACCO45_012754 [Purpureocillium lilacinum]|uniref:Uncharacterized protein n=1 Tax=Purpureocillium lilacinum TaxID=33203 RepID=A0ACC4DBH3_PURLI